MNIDEAPMKTAMQELRQRVAAALATKEEAKLATDRGYEVQLEMRGIRIGTVSTLKTMLNWIDEIAEVASERLARVNLYGSLCVADMPRIAWVYNGAERDAGT